MIPRIYRFINSFQWKSATLFASRIHVNPTKELLLALLGSCAHLDQFLIQNDLYSQLTLDVIEWYLDFYTVSYHKTLVGLYFMILFYIPHFPSFSHCP